MLRKLSFNFVLKLLPILFLLLFCFFGIGYYFLNPFQSHKNVVIRDAISYKLDVGRYDIDILEYPFRSLSNTYLISASIGSSNISTDTVPLVRKHDGYSDFSYRPVVEPIAKFEFENNDYNVYEFRPVLSINSSCSIQVSSDKKRISLKCVGKK